jgi:hypothetical protein
MSDDGTLAPGAPNETPDTNPKLSRPGSASEPTDQLADFIKQQPLTAALAALVVGYLLGKVT